MAICEFILVLLYGYYSMAIYLWLSIYGYLYGYLLYGYLLYGYLYGYLYGS